MKRWSLAWIGGMVWAMAIPALALSALETERFGAPALAVGSSIYVCGGYSNHGLLGVMERVDVEEGVTGQFPLAIQPRYFHSGAVHEGQLILVGGQTLQPGSGCGASLVYLDVVEAVDPEAGTVRRLPPLPQAVARPGAAVVNGRLYVIGGELSNRRRTGAVQIFDFATEEWSAGTDMPVAREGVVMEADGRIYAPGGYTGSTAIRDFQVYDPATDEWQRLPSLPVKLSAHHGLVADGKLYTFGDYEILDRTAVYDFETEEWALIELDYKPSRHQACARVGDDVFVIGGNVSPRRPYFNYIQRYSLDQLVAAPRLPWEPGAEKVPATPTHAALAGVRQPRGGPGSLTRFDLSGKPAPALEMPLFDGGDFSLATHTGKVVVLDFWSTTCPPCIRALPELAEMARDYEDKDVLFVGVSLDAPSRRDRVKEFLAERDIPFPMGHGTSQTGRDFGVRGIPCLVVVDRDGIVQGRLVGFGSTTKATLRHALDRLLAGEAAPVADEAPRRAASCGAPARSIPPRRLQPPDPRFFRLVWRQELDEPATIRHHVRSGLHLPSPYLVVRAGEGLRVLDADSGEVRHRVPLPAEFAQQEENIGGRHFVFLRDGDSGVMVSSRMVYEVTESSTGSRRMRGLHYEWIGFSMEGETLWRHEIDQNELTGVEPTVLPAGAGRDFLIATGWQRVRVLDPRGREVFSHTMRSGEESWSFRVSPSGDSARAVIVSRNQIACYEIVFPGESSIDERYFDRRWSRPATAQDVLGLPEARLHVQAPQRFFIMRSADRLKVLNADDGEPVADVAIPPAWRPGGDATADYTFMRDGGAGVAVVLRITPGADEETPAAYALAALNEAGEELWRDDFEDVAAEAKVVSLPDGADRDLLLVQCWNRLRFYDAGGRLLAEQPMGVADIARVLRATPDGLSFELLEVGESLTAYRWKGVEP